METSDFFKTESHDVVIGNTVSPLRLKTLALRLVDSYMIWIGDASCKFTGLSLAIPSIQGDEMPDSSTVYHATSAAPSSRSVPETTLATRLTKRLGCPIYLSLSIDGDLLDKWDQPDRLSQTTLSQDFEKSFLEKFNTFLSFNKINSHS